MNDRNSWLWLTAALGPGVRTGEILQAFPDARSVYEATSADRRISGVFTPRQLSALESTPVSVAEKAAELVEKNGWHIITAADDGYPHLLSRIDTPPLVLFVRGSLDGINSSLCLGIVGTRKPSPESVRVARTFAAEIADSGAVIVSGGALGIDTAAHEGALLANGRTVSVMGCGLNDRYISRNAALYSEIVKNGGAVISEFLPDTSPGKATFPIRNRIISGMSVGVLVVEAGEHSGSIITAGCAASQGRDVFAVPGSVVTSDYAGANKLIRDGAKPVFVAEDIIDEYRVLYQDLIHAPSTELRAKLDTCPTVGGYAPAKASGPAKAPEKTVHRTLPQYFDDSSRKVYSLLSDTPAYPGDIAVKSGLTLSDVFTALTNLEIEDFASVTDGGRYIIK